ncbi:hypothetical protein [Cupriavidus metallidurans]|uniref:Uncharacterized protein n=1 Tax=Cupriavidus metallidurans TaxID=119219 RepID=A0A482ITX4_9BURK|nr:hypothetical protein [Cupriavidus metallidurans]QBP12505.1 hypothetical protein DDF84_022525 [Cupriavidus metallidurans]
MRKLIGEYPSRKAGMFDTESSMAEEPVISEDYGSAVVQVVCLLYERAYHLVFASTELNQAGFRGGRFV